VPKVGVAVVGEGDRRQRDQKDLSPSPTPRPGRSPRGKNSQNGDPRGFICTLRVLIWAGFRRNTGEKPQTKVPKARKATWRHRSAKACGSARKADASRSAGLPAVAMLENAVFQRTCWVRPEFAGGSNCFRPCGPTTLPQVNEESPPGKPGEGVGQARPPAELECGFAMTKFTSALCLSRGIDRMRPMKGLFAIAQDRLSSFRSRQFAPFSPKARSTWHSIGEIVAAPACMKISLSHRKLSTIRSNRK